MMNDDQDWVIHYYDVPEGVTPEVPAGCGHSEGKCNIEWCPKCHKEKLHRFTKVDGMTVYEVQSCECGYRDRHRAIGQVM